MANWQNFYLQKMGVDGQGNAYPICESVATWGIFCKEIPFALAGSAKSPAKNEWYDEHGVEEYISPTGLYMDAYDMTVKFGCKAIVSGSHEASVFNVSVESVRANVAAFIEYLRTSGMMKMYSSYTGVGRQDVRLDSYDDGDWVNDNGVEMLVFDIKFKVNDPITEITLE